MNTVYTFPDGGPNRPFRRFSTLPSIRSCVWFALVCGVGDYVWKLQEDELDPTFLPLREAEVSATLFFVGHYLEFTAVDDGELVCFANDADHLYWNNQGQLVVDVARTSWPPTRYTNYEADLANRAVPP